MRNQTVTEGMKQALSGERTCEIVKSNITTRAPPYPYVSYTVTSRRNPAGGTDGRLSVGVYVKNYTQVWSVTVQSDRDEEAGRIAGKLHAWFQRTGRLYLCDNGITVQSVEPVGNRDHLLTVRYEYRRGFDVKFTCQDVMEFEEPVIESVELKEGRF